MPAEAVIAALRHVWLTLEPLRVPVAVMGGLALAAWKYVRATRDIDLLLGIGQSDLAQVLDRLAAAGVRPKRIPPLISLGELDVVQLLYEPPETFLDVQVDLLLGKSEYHQVALNRRVPTHLPELDVPVAILTCEDLVLHKLMAGRLIDRVDAAGLLRANRTTLENHYLTQWAKRLGVADELTEAWSEAFPGEPPPLHVKG